MTTLFLILIIISSVLLALIVLIQNPKGGGLAGNISGLSNQFMGVKQTNDVLEKGTWILSSALIILCIVSALVISSKETSTGSNDLNKIPTTGNSLQQPVAPSAPSATTSPADSNAK